MKNHLFSNFTAAILCFGFSVSLASAQDNPLKLYGKANPFTVEQLPAGELKTNLEKLDATTRKVAMDKLHKMSFHGFDAAKHLRVDKKGAIYMACTDLMCKDHDHASTETQESAIKPAVDGSSDFSVPTVAKLPVPISAPPVYSSKPAAPYHLYLDFNGAIVTGTAWNDQYARFECLPWSRDNDLKTFNDTEQDIMFQTWQRISEDFASFNINVTTDVTYDPDNYTGNKNRVGWVLHTPTIDKNKIALPHAGAGGVAYVGVFGEGKEDYATTYSPAWTAIQGDGGLGRADFFAEVSSHEFGHNLGLSHDGLGSAPYHPGHGSGDLTWAPLMGAGYNMNMTQWSQGDYASANQFQDDLALIEVELRYLNNGGYAQDDHNDTTATELVVADDLITITSTTPQTDPTNQSPQNKGKIERNTDLDIFSFVTGDGVVDIDINTWKNASNTNGNNLDLTVELYDNLAGTGDPIVSSLSPVDPNANITADLRAGTYYLHITNSDAGNPRDLDATGYSNYGSLGQYFISGTVVVPTPRLRVLSITPNEGENSGSIDVVIEGRLFNANTEVYLKKAGRTDIRGIVTSVVSPDEMNVTFPITGAAVGLWDLYAYNPEVDLVPAEEDTLASAFTVTLPVIDFLSENFDASNSLPSGWKTYTTTGATPLWQVDTTSSQTPNNSVGVTTSLEPHTKYLETPSISIPSAAINLQFSFWQSCKLETGYDGGVLELSVDGGAWFDVTASDSGAVFESIGYNHIISSDYRSSIGGRYAWSGDSKGYVQSVINLTNAAKYAGKKLRLRWLIATDNSASSSNWNIDTVELTGSFDPEYTKTPVNNLVVTASGGLSFSGNYGGPFSPTSRTYTLSNDGFEEIKWTASKTASWVTLSQTSGSLTPGSSTTFSVSINSNSLSLPVGAFTDTISIKNLSLVDEVITRGVSLTVNPIPTKVSITNLTQAYNGSPKSVKVTTNPAGVPFVVTYNGISTPPTQPGTYVVVATVNSNRHVGSATANMTVYQVPNLVRTTVTGVTNSRWTTVNLGKTYRSPVIVATPIYNGSNLPPVVTRIRNVTSTSFELKLARADGLSTPVKSMSVAVVAMNEGVYTVALQGVKMEAVKFKSTLTASGTTGWNAEARTYKNTYTKPVVVGQVMSHNDSRWSVFWSRGARATSPISAKSFNVGKHVGLDPAKRRANETIGYIVIESGTGRINGVRYQAAIGTDIVRCFGNSATPYNYTLTGLSRVSTAAVSQTGMDGTEGSWAVLSGAPALTKTKLKLHVAEDGFNNILRKHTTEQVAYIVFE